MPGNEGKTMTKRKKSGDLVKARKETKRLQREARIRIRKARKQAQESGDAIELKKVEKISKNFEKSLKSTSTEKLPKSFKNNVMRERGKALNLERLLKNSSLSTKGKKRVTRRTFEKLFGKEKTRELSSKIGGREMSRMSNQFWDEMYKAQDKLYAAGIVPADEIMGKYGSIGSGLLKTGKIIVNDGYWSDKKVTIMQADSGGIVGEMPEPNIVIADAGPNYTKVENKNLSDAIVDYYKQKYGLE